MNCQVLRNAALACAVCCAIAAAGDRVRRDTRSDHAQMCHGLTGSGVIVAILDRGIDWTHPDFIKPDGTTRIRAMLDMTGQDVCNGGPQPVEYSEAQINAALKGGPPLGMRDAVGHGTVTTGLAAGNGRAFANGRYRGIAPEADLIIVKLVSEGAPAHGNEPAEAAFQGCWGDALDWLDAKIDELNRPCVALINSGVQWGPMDGTSAVSRKIDEVFGEHRPGRAYVAASGDEGSHPTHAGGAYADGQATRVRFTLPDSRSTYLSLWYTGAVPAEVTIAMDDGAVVGPVPPGGGAEANGIAIYQYHPGEAFYPWTSNGPDRAIWMRLDGHVGGGEIRLRAVTPGQGRFDAYNGDIRGFVFENHVVPGRLTDYATTRSAIVAGAHVVRTEYVDIDGIPRYVGDEGLTGQLWLDSSAGPTRDGREYGIDLTAPGHNAFAAYATRSWWGTFRGNLAADGGGLYGRAGATSGSAPIVVGAIAALLQVNPTLTAEEVRTLLRASAREDAETGATPNRDWGFGKLDLLAAANRLLDIQTRPGDTDCDGTVDLADHGRLSACLQGPRVTVDEACLTADVDRDFDVDLADAAAQMNAFGK